MHRKRAEQLSHKQKERYFISLYLKRGAVDEGIPYAERRACLEPGTGQVILKRKDVQAEIKTRMESIRLEQMRQQLVGDAVARATAKLQADRDGIARRRHRFDERNLLLETTYFDVSDRPTHDRRGVATIRVSYGESGKRTGTTELDDAGREVIVGRRSGTISPSGTLERRP